MASTSKILTVSYGTFSCTLEGFDDSFETMKAIAEYFRDLAADDRYFGAEPPVPDAEMLARIAEREISHRVEARQERGAIVLRPSEPAPAPVMQDPVAPAVAEPAAAPVATPEVMDAPEPQAPVAEVMADPAPTPATDDSIAAKLRRIRAVVAQGNDTPDATYSEDQHAEAFLTEDSAALDAVLAEGPDADAPALTDEVDSALDALMAETAADTVDEDDSTLADFLAEADLPETDASDLAVTDEAQIDADEAGADEQADDTAALLASLAQEAEVEAEVEAEAPAPEQAETDTDDLDEDDVAGILERLAGMNTAKPKVSDVEPETEIDQDAQGADDTAAAVADLIDPAPQAAETAPEPADDPAPAPVRARARVVKIKRSALELAVAKGQLEAADDDDDSDGWDDDAQDDWSAVSEETSLSPEEEDDLRRELAAVEAELAQAPEAEDEADTVESIFADLPDDRADLHDRRPARDHLEPAANERDMTRIMAKTLSEMEEPETASRRSAIAHMRAAVAATRADRDAGVTPGEDTISDAFRADLASVVRPRRPRAEGGATPRPGSEPARPAPLKLVAEQRIDAPTAPAAPVRPRRISVAQAQAEAGFDSDEDTLDDTSAASGFADYAEQQGAQSLAEILEAAASYLAFVEGRDQFSRPQLMTRARSVIGEGFSREDGLRSFGLLLRQGKIQKARGGRFTVSDDIGFQPNARRAG